MYRLSDNATSSEMRKIYDEWAQEYDHDLVEEHAYAMPNRGAKMAAERCKDTQISVLDVGCGTGLSGQALIEAGFKNIDGCDLSPNMLSMAKERNVYRKLFEVDLLAPPMTVADNSYDLTIAIGAFATGHLGAEAVIELVRITRKRGEIIITTNDHFYETGILQAVFEELKSQKNIENFIAEHGAHIPGKNIEGWVFAFTKA